MDSLQRVAVVFAAVAVAAWGMVAYSVAETIQEPAETPSHQRVSDPGISGSSTEPLSDRLDRSRGVLRPPGGIDPGLTQSPPSAGPRSTAVVSPPGTRGDQSEINPK